MKNMEWIASEGELDYEKIKAVEDQWKIKFPIDFVKFVLKKDGATPEPSAFDFEGKKGGLLVFCLVSDRIVKFISWIYIIA